MASMHKGQRLKVAAAVLLAPLAVSACGSSSSSTSTPSVQPSVPTSATATDTTTTAATTPKTDSLCSVLSQDEVARVTGMTVESMDSSDKLQCRWQLSSSGSGGIEDAFELGNASGTFAFPPNPGTGHKLFTALRHIYDTSTPPAQYQLVPSVADALILTDSSGYEGVVLVRGGHVFLATPVPGVDSATELAKLLGDRLCNLSGPLNGPC